MGLIAWDQETDPYSHEVLTSNFARIDQHNHTLGKGEPIGTEALTNEAVTEAKIASEAVSEAKLSKAVVAKLLKFAEYETFAYTAGTTVTPSSSHDTFMVAEVTGKHTDEFEKAKLEVSVNAKPAGSFEAFVPSGSLGKGTVSALVPSGQTFKAVIQTGNTLTVRALAF